jgi:hypothetical protein
MTAWRSLDGGRAERAWEVQRKLNNQKRDVAEQKSDSVLVNPMRPHRPPSRVESGLT